MATGGPPDLSAAVNPRPVTTGIFIADKIPGCDDIHPKKRPVLAGSCDLIFDFERALGNATTKRKSIDEGGRRNAGNSLHTVEQFVVKGNAA